MEGRTEVSLTSDVLEHPHAWATHSIRIEERRTPEAYVVEAELPGVDPEQGLLATIENGLLILRAERSARPEGIRRPEFRYGSFSRTTRLPPGSRPEEVTAEYRHGVLTITVPLTARAGGPHVPAAGMAKSGEAEQVRGAGASGRSHQEAARRPLSTAPTYWGLAGLEVRLRSDQTT